MRSPKKPPLAPETPGRNGFTYKPQFGVVVLCRDEAQQAEIYERLKTQGYRCKVVSV